MSCRSFVAQSANLAQLLAGCFAGDFDLIRDADSTTC